MQSDSIKKTITVAAGVCFVCSIFVATATVSLKPKQEENKKTDKLKNILIAGDLYDGKGNVEDLFKQKIKAVVIDLKTGKELSENQITDELKPENFDLKKLSGDSKYGKSIPQAEDIAKIKTMPKVMLVYEVVENSQIKKYIFPVWGKGLWSTMYGFLALDNQLQIVKGITFYEHGETPGLGGEIENPKWQKIWFGKQIFAENGDYKFEIIKGTVDKTSEKGKYQVDGISGSTLTSRGVDQMVKFWMGNEAYGPFIKNIKEGKHE